MMDTTWLIPFFIYFNSQQSIRPFQEDYHNCRFHIQTTHQMDVGSNFFTGNILTSYLQGLPIDRKRREDLIDRYPINDRAGHHLGLELYNDVTFYYKPETMFKSDSWAMFGGIKNRILTQASFSSRLGEAVLLGNAHLEDEEINLNGFGFDYWQYQQLQFGLIKTKKVKNVWMNFGAALSFVNGNNWMNFQNQNGYLYTAPDGEYVEAKLNGEFRQSNENNSGFFANNGYGASLDLFLEGKTSDIKFFISAQDIGGIAFQKNARTYAFDTTLVFQGLEFESVTNIGENYFDILNDSLQNIIQGVKRSANHFAFLPTQISGGISTDLTTKTSAHFFVNYRLGGHYSPQFIFRMQWKTLPKLNLGFNALLGGYHTTGLGADIAYNIGSGYVVSGGMRSFLGFIAPNTSTGISGFFSFVKYFGK